MGVVNPVARAYLMGDFYCTSHRHVVKREAALTRGGGRAFCPLHRNVQLRVKSHNYGYCSDTNRQAMSHFRLRWLRGRRHDYFRNLWKRLEVWLLPLLVVTGRAWYVYSERKRWQRGF